MLMRSTKIDIFFLSTYSFKIQTAQHVCHAHETTATMNRKLVRRKSRMKWNFDFFLISHFFANEKHKNYRWNFTISFHAFADVSILMVKQKSFSVISQKAGKFSYCRILFFFDFRRKTYENKYFAACFDWVRNLIDFYSFLFIVQLVSFICLLVHRFLGNFFITEIYCWMTKI